MRNRSLHRRRRTSTTCRDDVENMVNRSQPEELGAQLSEKRVQNRPDDLKCFTYFHSSTRDMPASVFLMEIEREATLVGIP